MSITEDQMTSFIIVVALLSPVWGFLILTGFNPTLVKGCLMLSPLIPLGIVLWRLMDKYLPEGEQPD